MVRRILHNEFYTGTFVYNKTTKSKLDGGRCIYYPKEKWKRIYNHHEPIVSKKTYVKAEELLASRRKSHLKGYSESKYSKSPISGMVRCSKCGYKVRFNITTDGEHITGRNIFCYHCRMLDEEEKFPPIAEIETEVFNILKSKFHADEKDKKRLLDEQKNLYEKNDKLAQKILRDFEKYKLGKLERESFIKIKNELKEETELNLKRIDEIDEELKSAGTIEKLTSETVKKYIKTIYISANGIERIEYR